MGANGFWDPNCSFNAASKGSTQSQSRNRSYKAKTIGHFLKKINIMYILFNHNAHFALALRCVSTTHVIMLERSLVVSSSSVSQVSKYRVGRKTLSHFLLQLQNHPTSLFYPHHYCINGVDFLCMFAVNSGSVLLPMSRVTFPTWLLLWSQTNARQIFVVKKYIHFYFFENDQWFR